MPVVTVTIGSSKYDLVCGEGEQENLINLAQSINNKVEEIMRTPGFASESLVMAIVALNLEDENDSLKRRLAEKEKYGEVLGQPASSNNENYEVEISRRVKLILDPVVNSIENLAKTIEEV